MLAKYLSTPISRLTTATSSVSYVTNSRAAKNTAAEKNPVTIEDDNFHFSDYLNDSDDQNKDQSALPNDHQSSSRNSVNRSDETPFIESEGNLDAESSGRLISDHEDEDEELMLDIEKAKWILADDPIEAMELHFESLGFQNMAKFYGMKNMGGLKQHRAFKKRCLVKAAEKIQKTRKIFAEQVGIGENLTRKQWYWAMGLDDILEPPEWPVES